MFSGNFRLALSRLRSSKWHSLLTMFGIIVGVVSVVTTVSLGEGIKHQVLSQVGQIGSDLITVRPGKVVTRDKNGTIVRVDPNSIYGFGSGSLSEDDLKTVSDVKNISKVVSINYLNSSPKTSDSKNSYDAGFVLGTDPDFPNILQHKVEYGEYFSAAEEGRSLAIIGKRVAEQLFEENIPVGQSVVIRGHEYIVRGVFAEFGSSAIGQGIDLNKAVFIARPQLRDLAGDAAPLSRVLIRPQKGKADQVVRELNSALLKAHGGQQDVTVLKQDENLVVADDVLTLLTKFVASIAAISLLVGGIGIMNIMLVSISERTHEIGIRKAVGATNRQIRNQFMAEAIVISSVGGIVGVLLSLLISFIIRVTTNLQPVIAWPVVAIAVGVSIAVGIIFGTIPAIKAARKDPIDSLRLYS